MTTTCVLFIQGGGEGAHDEDAPLAASLRRALGPRYDVRFPLMPREADPDVEAWNQKIASELSLLHGKVILVAHSIGGSILLRYLLQEKVEKPIAGVFLLAAPSWDEGRWNFEDLKLPSNVAEELALIPRLFSTTAVMTRWSLSLTLRFTANESRKRSPDRSTRAGISSTTT